jgi:hypothetical protein
MVCNSIDCCYRVRTVKFEISSYRWKIARRPKPDPNFFNYHFFINLQILSFIETFLHYTIHPQQSADERYRSNS